MIGRFRGRYKFLSNFYPCSVEYDGSVYPSLENAYQAAKTKDPELRKQFLTISASEAKKLGRRLTLEQDWEKRKEAVMLILLRRKFKNLHLASLLLETGDQELIEGNTWDDTFWGVCGGVGENRLGQLLMLVRTEVSKL